MLIEMEHPKVGRLKIAGSGFKMSETPGRVTGRAPGLGEHNEEVLGRHPGLLPRDDRGAEEGGRDSQADTRASDPGVAESGLCSLLVPE